MSKYTTEVRFICEESAGLVDSSGYKKVEDVLTLAIPRVFDFNYPIFDESYREVLERKILRHFYTREICEETVGLWKLRLDDKMNVIMPYYNQLYKSELLKFNPLYDVEYSSMRHGKRDETVTDENKYDAVSARERTNESENTSEGNVKANDIKVTKDKEKGNGSDSSNSWDLYSDTPQGGISGIANAYEDPSLGKKAYLTNARNVTNEGTNQYERGNEGEAINKSDSTETNQSNLKITENNKDVNSSTDNRNRNAQNLENYLENVHGKRGGKSFSALLKEYRSTFLNIDAMILEELEPLFMQLW